VLKLVKAEQSDKAIMAKAKCGARTVHEVRRLLKGGVPELVRAVKKPPSAGGVALRPAAQAAQLPKPEQRKLIKRLAGQSQAAGLRILRNLDAELETVRRGRDPNLYPLARERCQSLAVRLREAPRTSRAAPTVRAYEQVLSYLAGDKELDDLPWLKQKAKTGGRRRTEKRTTARASAMGSKRKRST